jgi:hypothetical protein
LRGIILYIPTDKGLQADGHRREDNERNHKSRFMLVVVFSLRMSCGIIHSYHSEKVLQADGHC